MAEKQLICADGSNGHHFDMYYMLLNFDELEIMEKADAEFPKCAPHEIVNPQPKQED